MAFLQQLHAYILSIINIVVLVEMVILFKLGVEEGVLVEKVTTRKIVWLTVLTLIPFCLWQRSAPDFVWLNPMFQVFFSAFAGLLAGCILKKGYSNFLRSL